MGGGCDITLGQKIDSKVKALASIDSTDTKAIREKVKTDMKAQVDQAAAAKSGMFATAASVSKTTADYKTKIDNIVETNMTDTQQTSAFASAYNKNTGTLDIGECSGNAFNKAKLALSQNIASDLQAAALLKNVSSAIQDYEKSTTSSTETKQTATATGGGLEDIIKALNEGYAIFALLCFCLCCCCCIGIIAMSMPKSNGGAAPSS
jgi:hypothetical protein